jgi:hypothetical protein
MKEGNMERGKEDMKERVNVETKAVQVQQRDVKIKNRLIDRLVLRL